MTSEFGNGRASANTLSNNADRRSSEAVTLRDLREHDPSDHR